MNIGSMQKNMSTTTLRHDKKGDGFDDWVMAVNQLFGYSDKTIDYPEVDEVKPNQGIQPEWFYGVMAGPADFSEINAIKLYRSNVNKHDDVATLFSGVSFVEMQHYDHLQELILALGGKPDTIAYDNSTFVKLSTDSKDNVSALKIAIQGEKDTIAEYRRIKLLCREAKDSPTKMVALQLLNKLIADEKVHLQLYQEKLNNTKVITVDLGV